MIQLITNRNNDRAISKALSASVSGFTLIELMIVLAVIGIILTLAIPTYSNYSIRTKIGEAVSVSEAAKTSLAAFCNRDRSVINLNDHMAEFEFRSSKYVKKIVLGGSCQAPVITMTTQATGAKPSPVLTFNGEFAENADQITWTCVSSGLNIHLPESCRSW
jgi:type IV pilus assembly protein PilA